MSFVQAADAVVSGLLNGFIGHRIAPASDQMAKGVTTECVPAEQYHIEREHKSADADPEAIRELRRNNDIVREDHNKNER